ncbi:MAG: patatin-like phospholipase family protein [Bdellovibrionota bacterium]
MDNQYKEVRIMYAGSRRYIHQLRQDFLKFGAPLRGEDELAPFTIHASLFKRLAPSLHSFPSITIHLYQDVYELAKELSIFDADLIILDERNDTAEYDPMTQAVGFYDDQDSEFDPLKVLHSTPQFVENKDGEELLFENLKSAIEKFTPREFNYTMRRVIVVVSKEDKKNDREFTLGLAQVRTIVVDPPSSVDLFLHAVQSLLKYYNNHKKTSLCFSGGGLEGYLYSIGVAYALDQCFGFGKSCSDFDIFCGVSSGAIISSCIAANIPRDRLIKQLHHQDDKLENFNLGIIFDLATKEIARKGFSLLKAFSTKDLGEAITRFQNSVPVGFFRGEKLKNFVDRQMETMGVENNISALKKELYIGATDQDTGEYVILGEEPWKNVKISQAVRASAALPPFYLPEKINGHWFSDGQIAGGSGFNHAIHKGAGLVVNVDPMVAYTSNMPGAIMKRGGYFTLLQSAKGLVQSRAASMLKHSMDKHPDVDFINFQPTDEVMEAMAGNPMKYRIRTELVDLGYKSTVSQILASYDAMAHKFAKHGFALKSRAEILEL